MSPINNNFKKALSKLILMWQKSIASALESGQSAGTVNADVSPEETAVMIISGYGGVRNIGKIMGRSAYKKYLRGLKKYLDKI